MQHYFVTESVKIGEQLILSDEIAHRIIKVRRSRTGETIELVDAKQEPFLAEIIALKGNEVLVKIIAESPMRTELPVATTIFAGSSKSDKNEFLIQKATEFGATAIVFSNFEYTIAKIKDDKVAKKLERYQKIAQQAAEQSRRLVVPTVQIIDKITDFDFTNYDQKFVAYEEAAKDGEKSVLHQMLDQTKPNDRVIAAFGPEGGISPLEIAYFKEQDFVVGALGKRILRAESAPMYFLSAESYQLEMS